MSDVSDCICCGQHIMVNDVEEPELCEECAEAGCADDGCGQCYCLLDYGDVNI